MKYLLVVVIMLAIAANGMLAQLPPLIDRDLFFGDPEISAAQISPNGKYISFIKPFKNVRNIWVKERKAPFDKAKPITADTTRPVRGYFWSHDSKYVLYVQDKGGDENFRVYAVDPTAAGDPVPPARDLTPIEKVRASIIDVPRKHPNEILVGLNDRRADLHDVYRINITTGERTLIRKNDENVAGWVMDLDGALRLAARIKPDGGTEILRVEKDTLVQIYSVNFEENCGPLRFTPDGKKFYLLTNKGDEVDKSQLQLFDLATGKTSLVDKDPKNEVDFSGAIFSDVTDEILATIYIGDKPRVYPKTKKFEAMWKQLQKVLPKGEISLGSSTEDEMLWMVAVSSDVDPGSRYLFDVKTGKAAFLYSSRPNLPSKHLAPMKPVKYKARDGMTIYGYLTLPKGIPSKNLPTLMNIHGGPWARDMWGYNSEAQFFANRGYAVFQPNFRGSSGYGKKYLNAGNKQWGTGAMQHDITDAVKYLIEQGIADPKRVAIYGGSYGGYATLAGLAFTPELYAAGISYVGPSNIITLLNSIPPYWAPIKKIFAIRVGDMEKPEDLKRLEEQSPLNSAKNIHVPLLVVQGANDPRVKQTESDQIVVAVRDQGKPVEYLVAPDEGHGFAGKENRLAMYTASEKFLAKHIKGRYQESVTPEVQKKLEALTIDVKTVKMPEKPKVEIKEEAMPAFNPALVKKGETNYTSKVSVRGRDITINSVRSVTDAGFEGKRVLRIIEQTSGMMGSGSDTVDLDATTLLPVRRNALQGMATITMQFKPDVVEGRIKAGPQDIPLNIKVTKPVLVEGGCLDVTISTLPLAEGYKATLYTLDLMAGKVKPYQLAVVGKDSTTVSAGSFETFKLEVTPIEEGSSAKMWISVSDRVVVKAETKLGPQMGGGTVVTELTK